MISPSLRTPRPPFPPIPSLFCSLKKKAMRSPSKSCCRLVPSLSPFLVFLLVKCMHKIHVCIYVHMYICIYTFSFHVCPRFQYVCTSHVQVIYICVYICTRIYVFMHTFQTCPCFLVCLLVICTHLSIHIHTYI